MKEKRGLWAVVLVFIGLVFTTGCADTRLSETIIAYTIINAPPERAWDYMFKQGEGCVLDQSGEKYVCERWPELEVTDLQGEGVGQTYNWTFQKYRGEGVVAVNIPNRKRVDIWSGDMDCTTTVLMAPHEKGTKFIMILEYSLDLPKGTGILKKQAAKEMEKNTDQALKVIKEKVEGK